MAYKHIKNWRENNSLKNRAHKLVFVELRAGRLKKKACFCGNDKVQAHHENYYEPLKIKWLCKKHHCEADKILRDKKINIISKKEQEKEIIKSKLKKIKEETKNSKKNGTKVIRISKDSHKRLRVMAADKDTTIIDIIDALLVDKEIMKKLTINK